MHISLLGGSAVKVQVKPFDKDVTLVIDPIKPEKGTFVRSTTADIALYTHGQKDSVTVSGNPFVIDHPGEWEISQVLIAATPGSTEGTNLIRFDVEGMSVAHLGLEAKQLTNAQLELLGNVDILLLNVGGEPGYTPEMASKTANLVEARVVIPYGFQSDNQPDAAPVSKFVSEMGITPEEEGNKVVIKKKDLPQENTRLIVLTKE